MDIKEQTIAHIGLGRMGSGIAKNIQATGCHFTVYNRSTEKMQPFVAAGAKAARTPREAASDADIVVTSLMDDKSVFDVMLGDDGLLAGMRGGAIHIGTSTISPAASTRCFELHAAQGSHYLSAPFTFAEKRGVVEIRGQLETCCGRLTDQFEHTCREAAGIRSDEICIGSLLLS